jgi:cytidylate kinase
MTLFIIQAVWDPQASVWVAESDDVPGLAAEAASLETLRPKLLAMISDLVEENNMVIDGDEIAIHVVAHSSDKLPNPRAA